MIRKTLIATAVLLSAFIISATAYASNANIIATLDDKNVTVEILTIYVKDVAGKKYEPWLNDKEGLRKLADFYINRTLLLDYARKTVDKKNTIVTNHNARSMDADVMLLSSLLQSEVQDKVHVTEEEVRAYMIKNNTATEKVALQKMESDLKNGFMETLIAKVRAGHNIKYFQ